MNIIAGGRGTGKTCRLLDLAYKNNAIVVCKEPDFLMKKAHGYGITGLRFMSFEDYSTFDNGRNDSIYIYNIKDYLNWLDNNIDGYSLTLEDLK